MNDLRVVVEADGGSRGNPGPAGYGAVVREAATGEVLLERCGSIGTATNNVAEYSGLIGGLTAAAELGATHVEVRMDSKLVVEQMSGRWQIKNPGLRPLAAQAATLVGRFRSVSFDWIPRDRNRAADALANQAMDEAAGRPAAGATTPSPAAAPSAVAAADSPGRIAAREAAARAAARDAATPDSGRPGSGPAGSPAGGPGSARVGSAPAASRSPASASAGSGSGSGGASAGSGGSGSGGASAGSGGSGSGRASAGSWEPPGTETATRLVLVRHGETAMTEQKRYSGRGDVPLSERGEAQALAAATRLAGLVPKIAAVVSSPLIRCVRTAELICGAFDGAPLVVEPDLVECDFGRWEGLTFAEVRQQWPAELTDWLGSTAVAPPDGESFQAVAKRVRRVTTGLPAAYPAAAVVVVSHVSPLKLMLRDALAAGDAFLHRLYLDPAGVSVMDTWPDGGVAVRSVNDTAHLR